MSTLEDQLAETILWMCFLEAFLQGLRAGESELSTHQAIQAANEIWRSGARDEWLRKLAVQGGQGVTVESGVVSIKRETGQVLADVQVSPEVIVECVKDSGPEAEWEVWGVRIDGKLYREPRDLQGEILAVGPFREMLNAALSVDGALPVGRR